MDVEITKELLRSGDPAQRGAAARELGRRLAAVSSGDWLLEFRRLASRLQRTASTDHDRGFLEALELVATGFERQVSEMRVDEGELVRIKTRAHWLRALRLLEGGVLRPSDLARQLDVHKSQISKLIGELEAAELVTQASEGKEKPCWLTPRARVLLEQLPKEPVADEARADQIVPVVVQCMGAIARNRRVARNRLREEMQSRLGATTPHVLRLLDQSLRESFMGFVDEDDDTIVATDSELQTRLALELALACAGQQTPLVSKLRELSNQERVLLRVANGMHEWDVLVDEQRLPRVSVIRDADALLTPPSLEQTYQVVYESPSLLSEDVRLGKNGPLIARAARRFYFGVDSTPRIKDFVPIEVAMLELSA